MSPKSMRTQRPSRAPSRRIGFTPASRSLSSISSTMAPTCRSLVADAMTNTSVSASWSLTSMAMTSWAILSSAASAATRANCSARGVADTELLGVWLCVQAVLVDVLDDPVRDEVPDGLVALDAGPAVGRADRHGGDLHEGDPVGRQPLVGQLVPGPGHPDEVRQLPELLDVLPREDLGQGVGSRDEEQLGVGVQV